MIAQDLERDPFIPQSEDAAAAPYGAALLDALEVALSDYVVFPSRAHARAVTLWVATTHAIAAFDYAPRLVVRSAEKRSGKSRLLEVIDATCHDPLRAVNATVSAIFRSLEDQPPPTLLLDEADTIFGSRKVAENNEDLRGLLNAGYQRGLPVLRTVGPQHTPTRFNTFAMAALAGIGAMPDTIEDRALVVVMRRRKPTEAVKPYRLRRDQPRLHALRDRMASWAQGELEALRDAMPEMPLEDRAADTWEPLIAVADAAGGHWSATARQVALQLTEEAEAAAVSDSTNVRLLEDIKGVFEISGPFIPSQELCDRLHEIEESPWKDWELNPSRLGHRLKEYGVRTAHNTERTKRGYRLEDFQDAFDRYTRPKQSEGVKPLQSLGSEPDTFRNLDTLKASSPSKASSDKPRHSNETHHRTPLDTLPRASRETRTKKPKEQWHDCAQCKHPVETEKLQAGLCRKCQAERGAA